MSSLPLPFAEHPRRHGENLYVYPVVSRRAGGISLGVNLNRDQFCNFDCVYCQVQRAGVGAGDAAPPARMEPIDLDRLAVELRAAAENARAGRLFDARMPGVPLRDIAFSGDGEPTAHPQFAAAVGVAAQVREQLGLAAIRLVVITNATLLHQPAVMTGVETLDRHGGILWCKLDAGTDAYFRLVNRTRVPFSRVLANLAAVSRARPIVVQSLFMRLRGMAPEGAELTAYCQRLNEIVASGGQIEQVQVHTIARLPAEAFCEPLRAAEVDAIARRTREETGLSVAAFYGAAD